MNQMTDIHNDLNEAMRDFPAFSFVWHRSSGARGLVDGWKICGDFSILISVTYGNASGLHYTGELSHSDPEETWKGQESKSA